MAKVLIRMIAGDNPVPEVIFIGFQDKSEALLFKIIINAEGGYKRIEDENGIHIVVNETQTEVQGRKCVPVIKEVHYFLQNVKKEYTF